MKFLKLSITERNSFTCDSLAFSTDKDDLDSCEDSPSSIDECNLDIVVDILTFVNESDLCFVGCTFISKIKVFLIFLDIFRFVLVILFTLDQATVSHPRVTLMPSVFLFLAGIIFVDSP